MYASYELTKNKLRLVGLQPVDLQGIRDRLKEVDSSADCYYLPRKGWFLRFSVVDIYNRHHVSSIRVNVMKLFHEAQSTLEIGQFLFAREKGIQVKGDFYFNAKGEKVFDSLQAARNAGFRI